MGLWAKSGVMGTWDEGHVFTWHGENDFHGLVLNFRAAPRRILLSFILLRSDSLSLMACACEGLMGWRVASRFNFCAVFMKS